MTNRAFAKSEAANRLGTSERTVDRLIRSGKLRAHKVGSRWRFLEADLEAFLASCATAPSQSSSEMAALVR